MLKLRPYGWLIGIAAWFFCSHAISNTFALLVGVSGYPSLPENRRLRGPANDVQLMRNALLRSGVAPSSIRILADGVPGSGGLPERQAILNGIRDLANQVQPGDWAIVYLSGHGSQQPQLPGKHAYIEADGLDEIFLPYDIGKWDGAKKAVQGAIIDDEIGQSLDFIKLKGARVWAIFDTCHAGDMGKGGLVGAGYADGGPVYRFVSPSALGIPKNEARKPNTEVTKRQPTRNPQQDSQGSEKEILFYASHPDEPAAEEPLPDLLDSSTAAISDKSINSNSGKRYFGLFTYLLAQALPTWKGDFGSLAAVIAQDYKVRPFPTPMFEGDLKQIPDFRKNIRSASLTSVKDQSPSR